jgi:DNA adenine methylase
MEAMIGVNKIAKPFVKWAGGKAQLIDEIDNVIPDHFKQTRFIYIEPFVGGGAVLFWILQKYPNIKRAIINDINTGVCSKNCVIL